MIKRIVKQYLIYLGYSVKGIMRIEGRFPYNTEPDLYRIIYTSNRQYKGQLCSCYIEEKDVILFCKIELRGKKLERLLNEEATI